jgi:hypothetical protein
MKRKLLPLLAVLAGAALATHVKADVWTESGDAGGVMPGQVTVGGGRLTSIVGELRGTNDEVFDFEDMYQIYIDEPTNFSATTVGGADFDTQLFLFNELGIGIAHNDDSASTLRSTLSSQFILEPGMYTIAVTGYNRDPVSASGLIWQNSPFGTERAADGPGAADPVNGWTGTGASGEYSIAITGATFANIPTPGAMALLGLGSVMAIKRKRK